MIDEEKRKAEIKALEDELKAHTGSVGAAMFRNRDAEDLDGFLLAFASKLHRFVFDAAADFAPYVGDKSAETKANAIAIKAIKKSIKDIEESLKARWRKEVLPQVAILTDAKSNVAMNNGANVAIAKASEHYFARYNRAIALLQFMFPDGGFDPISGKVMKKKIVETALNRKAKIPVVVQPVAG